jgi:integrase
VERGETVFKRGGRKNRGGSYSIQWFDHNGKRQTKSARTTDKATAERIAAKLESDAALRREGVVDPTLDAVSKESRRSIESHLADYEAKLRTGNRTDEHVSRTVAYIREIAKFAGFEVATDISADGVNRYATRLKDEGRAARTIQGHLTAIKSFTKWLTEHHKLPRNPLASVRKPNPKADRRRERRMLLPKEWPWLRSATLLAGENYGMAGLERVLLYETAIQTGLRNSELRSLTRGNLFLDVDQPFITCKARSTKNRTDARLYIQSDLAESLRQHASTKAPGARLFDLPTRYKLASMLREDLAAARRTWLKQVRSNPEERTKREQSDFLNENNHEGEWFDFHSLRHTCGAWLAMAGVHPKVVQTVMRHGSITLTMDTYGHLFPGQEADAVHLQRNVLGEIPAALAATGTDDAVVEAPDARSSRRSSCDAKPCPSDATRCEDNDTDDPDKVPSPTGRNILPLADLGDDVRHDATQNDSSRDRTRTGMRETPRGILSPVRLPIPPLGL